MARKSSGTPRVRRPRKSRRERAAEGEGVFTPDHQKEHDYWDWLNSRHKALQVLNRHPERPYWASIRDPGGSPPVANYYPCTMFRKSGRIYYGFLSRDHREKLIYQFRYHGARRELTGEDNGPLHNWR